MKKQRFFLWIMGLMLIVGIQACAGGMPSEEPAVSESKPVSTATQSLLPPKEQDAVPPAISESRLLTLEYPPIIRAGDADTIRLTLEVDEMGNLTPTAEVAGHEVSGEVVSVPNLYDTHNIIAEARLDMAGVQVLPSETVSEPLLAGKSVTFYWSISPASAGNYRGTLWLYLRFIPKEGGDEMRRVISSQLIEVESRQLFGMQAGTVRVVGTFGSFIGAVLGFPFVDDLFKWLWKWIKRRQA